MLSLLKQTLNDFLGDRCQTMAAALAYYTAFSLPPLMVLILLMLGTFMDPAQVQGNLQDQLTTLMGSKGAEQVQALIEQAQRPSSSNALTATLGIVTLLFGATGVFGELQAALNTVWQVKPSENSGGWKKFILKRAVSFTMVLGVAFLLLVSLTLSALISAFGAIISAQFDGGLSTPLLFVLDLGLSFTIFSLVFATIYKFVPDAEIAWQDVRAGAMGTATFFLIGKFIIGFYLGRSNPGQAYGAAGSLAVLLVWLYYSSMLLLFGAEFTQVWACEHGRKILPEKHAKSTADEPPPLANSDKPLS